MFNLARKIAQKSGHKQHHHAVILTIGGNIVATGANKSFLHAEERAILSYLNSQSLTLAHPVKDLIKACGKLTLWSFRWRKNGTWGNAKPCRKCSAFLWLYNVTKVWYTNEQGELTRL